MKGAPVRVGRRFFNEDSRQALVGLPGIRVHWFAPVNDVNRVRYLGSVQVKFAASFVLPDPRYTAVFG